MRMDMKHEIRKVEENMAKQFSKRKPFSEHLQKWEDAQLPDKYDHNCFAYCGQPSKEELEQAVAYQKKLGAGFVKLEGDEPLSDDFGFDLNVTLTMVLKTNGENWRTNPDLVYRNPQFNELEALEVKHFASLYGEDFTRRNIRRLFEKLTYHGAYLDERLIGACYSFCSGRFVCMDGLIVDENYRKRYVASSLIAHIKHQFSDKILFLHAAEDDTPKEMYQKMGFETEDRLYEYSCFDLSTLQCFC